MRELLFNPLYQGLFTVAFMLLLLLIFRVTGKPIAGWNSTVLIVILYCLVNAGVGISVSDIWVYTLKSLGVFLLLMFFAVFFAGLITRMSYEEFGDNAMIFVAPVIIYPVTVLLGAIIRLFKSLF
ncbi:MAG: hypothetical protein R6U65_07195 [Perlabentimonas sp.]